MSFFVERENVSCIHPHFIRDSFRLGKRSDEFSTIRGSCHPEKSSWLTSDTHSSVNPWTTSWRWWRSLGVPDLVLVCPLCFFFLFRCHAPCGDTGPVSRFSVSGDPSAWWVRWERKLLTKLYLCHSKSTGSYLSIFVFSSNIYVCVCSVYPMGESWPTGQFSQSVQLLHCCSLLAKFNHVATCWQQGAKLPSSNRPNTEMS